MRNLLENDEYAAVERAAALIWEHFGPCVSRGDYERISDRAVVMLFTTAVKLYARKCDDAQRTFRPLAGDYDELITPSEALTAATELLRALRLGPTEFALWARRRPEDYHDKSDPPLLSAADRS
jgi:hypothetical protein